MCVRIHIKFNSGTTQQNEVPNEEYYVEIDGNVYVDATGLYNRNPANGPIDYVESLGWAQKNPQPFKLWYEDIRISTGGFMSTTTAAPDGGGGASDAGGGATDAGGGTPDDSNAGADAGPGGGATGGGGCGCMVGGSRSAPTTLWPLSLPVGSWRGRGAAAALGASRNRMSAGDASEPGLGLPQRPACIV